MLRDAERLRMCRALWKSPQICPLRAFLRPERESTQAVRQRKPPPIARALRTSARRHYGALDDQERAMPRKNQYAAGPIIPGTHKRPSPPAQLDTRERRIWSAITARLPTDWFMAESEPMLKELCRHIRIADDLWVDLARARAAIDELRKMPEPPAELLAAATQEYRAVLRAHGYQSERIGNLATKLRLSPQSRYAPSTAKREAAKVIDGPAPWDDWGENRANRKQ
jgi:hypothetical protein